MDQISETFILLPIDSIRAGHYVPQLAEKIYDYNKATSQSVINLKGFIVSCVFLYVASTKYEMNLGLKLNESMVFLT